MTNNMDELDDRFKKSAENFSLIPSSGIWVNVEADIRKRERKKRFILLFFLLVGILTGGVILYNNHSASEQKQTALQKNNSTLTKHSTEQHDTLIEKDNSSHKIIALSQKLAENISQPKKSHSISAKKQSVNPIVSSTIKNEITSATQNVAIQNNSESTVTHQAEISTSITTTIYDAVADSIIPTSIAEITSDSLQPKIKTDSLLVTRTDTIKQIGVPEKKDSIKTTSHQSKWSIAFSITPTINYSKQEEAGNYQFISGYRDSSDKNLITLNYHLAVNYKFYPELELFTGLGIINFEQKILSRQAIYHYDTLPFSGPVPLVKLSVAYFNINGDSAGTLDNKFSWLEIPIGIEYNCLPHHKFNIAVQPEIAFNKLIGYTGHLYNYQNFSYEKIGNTDLKTWLVSYGVGISFQYAIIKNFQLELTPCYKSFQKSIYKSTYPISQRFQQTEFRFSLRYLLK